MSRNWLWVSLKAEAVSDLAESRNSHSLFNLDREKLLP